MVDHSGIEPDQLPELLIELSARVVAHAIIYDTSLSDVRDLFTLIR